MTTASTEPQRLPLQEKWGESLRQGFVVVPWVLMRRQKELGLDAVELVVLLHLVASWWDPNSAPYPSTNTIAERMDVSMRTVQRCLKALQDKGLLTKQPALASDAVTSVTRYDLTPLAARLAGIVTDQVNRAQEVRRAGEGIAQTLN